MKRYEVLATQLADDIRSGHIPIGSRLPSLRQIMAQRGVSQSTV
ncbi:MAG TPA: GntR family transcriptional regulator, partial [Paraburkholderia sp.]